MELARRLETARQKLFEARARRVHPHKDDKILTSWNGLMIAALSKAAQAFGEPSYAKAAERALDFLSAKLVREDGRLLARFRDGEAAFPAYLDDYAFLAWGLLELYEATFAVRHLDAALRLVREMERLFRDPQGGGYFFTGEDRCSWRGRRSTTVRHHRGIRSPRSSCCASAASRAIRRSSRAPQRLPGLPVRPPNRPPPHAASRGARLRPRNDARDRDRRGEVGP